MLPRRYAHLEKYLKKNQVLIIYGHHQTGKTTLLKSFLKQTSLKYKFDICSFCVR
jgi:predicted AAA+ superfamily ATPase